MGYKLEPDRGCGAKLARIKAFGYSTSGAPNEAAIEAYRYVEAGAKVSLVCRTTGRG
jgi:hypothetical protein